VKFIPDPKTPSGFRWSSSQGPPVEIFSGTLVSASIVTEEKRPISYVLPILRSAMGM
jgi:HlyD family secretion protein